MSVQPLTSAPFFYADNQQSDSESHHNSPRSVTPEDVPHFDEYHNRLNHKAHKTSDTDKKRVSHEVNCFDERLDAIVMEHVTSYTQNNKQPSWVRIATDINQKYSRAITGKQVRERYINHLDPHLDLSPITSEEKKFILEFIRNSGLKWTTLSTEIQAIHPEGKIRSTLKLKNWYNSAGKNLVLSNDYTNRETDSPSPSTIQKKRKIDLLSDKIEKSPTQEEKFFHEYPPSIPKEDPMTWNLDEPHNAELPELFPASEVSLFTQNGIPLAALTDNL
jgi:hypothetical protein